MLVNTIKVFYGVTSRAALSFLLCLLFFPFFANAAELKKVSFIPQWSPQAQFAGYYVAKEKGFYSAAGLDVTILRGGPDALASDYLQEGKADFGTLFLSKGIELNAKGAGLINIGQIVQRSSLMLVAKRSSGIFTPKEMNGRKVGLWGGEFDLQSKTLFREYGIEVVEVPQTSSMTMFTWGGVDVASAMWHNEYHRILNSGYNEDELITFFFFDYRLNFPEDGIYVSESLFSKNPALCQAFVQASIKGWLYAFEHPEETVDLMMRTENINLQSNRAHQNWMLGRMKDIILPNSSYLPIGMLHRTDFRRVSETMKRAGQISKIPLYSRFYKKCFGGE